MDITNESVTRSPTHSMPSELAISALEEAGPERSSMIEDTASSVRTHVVIVIPCLDEAELLRATCESLGFSGNPLDQPSDTTLVIVDNGSTDGSLSIARRIQQQSAPKTVVVAQEAQRGFVPPRVTGGLLAADIAETNHLPGRQTLVLQADADTTYCDGYVTAMRRAAASTGPHTLLEGIAEFSPGVQERLGPYLRLVAETDERVLASIDLPPQKDLICTDAVSAYLLEDYWAWGGHQREYAGDEEILAETTRLRIRSLPHGGNKQRVQDALAFPSERKAVRLPAEEFATAGFPRGQRWRSAWRRGYLGPATAEEFGAARDHPEVRRAIHVRKRHLLALFGLLPLHAARALGESSLQYASVGLRNLAASLPSRGFTVVAREPGLLIIDILGVVDHRPHELDALLRE